MLEERIHRRRLQMRFTRESILTRDAITIQLALLLHELPLEMVCEVLKHADPIHFAVIHTELSASKEVYRRQLRRLLHHCSFEPSAIETVKEVYGRALTARQCILRSLERGLFPLRTRFDILEWRFTQDYSFMMTLECYPGIPTLQVWGLHGEVISEIWTQDDICNAEFVSSNKLWISRADGRLEEWSFESGAPIISQSLHSTERRSIFASDKYLLVTNDYSSILYDISGNASPLVGTPLPFLARAVAFSPDADRAVFSEGRNAWICNLPPDLASRRPLRRDRGEPISQLIWSADNRTIVAISRSSVDVWRVDATESQPVRYSVADARYVVLESASISPDGVFLALGCKSYCEEPTLLVLDISKESLEEVYRGYQENGTGLSWFFDRRLAFAGHMIDIGDRVQRMM